MSTVTSIGAVIAVVIGIGAVIFIIANLRASRPEIGSEIELAPNRKPYYDDAKLETSVLDRTLRWAVVLIVVVSVGVPLYWLNEPGRMSGAVEDGEETRARRGAQQYAEGSACADCHGPDGVGGVAEHTLFEIDEETEEQSFIASVQWRAPALDTVLLRFTREEVADIIATGRPGTPMPGWSAEAGTGSLTEQQIENLVDYFESIQVPAEEAQQGAARELAVQLGLLDGDETDEAAIDRAIAQIDYENDPRVGEELFNLGQESGFAAGAYACGRCHTAGWSIIQDPETIELGRGRTQADFDAFVDFPDGSGALGFDLTGGLVPRKFATFDDLVEFIVGGSEAGEPFGETGIGSGRMPGFGENPNTDAMDDGMLTREMIEAIVRYESTLPAATTGDLADDEGLAPTVEVPEGPVPDGPLPRVDANGVNGNGDNGS